MGFRCPTCGEIQPDGVHLANHVAVAAAIGRADHADWLDEHAPDWGDRGPEELAPLVTEHADHVETRALEEGSRPAIEERRSAPPPGDEIDSILEEAREMTRRMHDLSEEDPD